MSGKHTGEIARPFWDDNTRVAHDLFTRVIYTVGVLFAVALAVTIGFILGRYTA